MEAVSNGLKYLFTYILYPCVLLGFFASICYLIYKIVKDAKDLNEMIRRIAAAALPVISLVFLIIAVDKKDSSNLKKFILSLNEFFKFSIGFIIGVDIVEAGRIFFKSQKEIWMSIYAISLSSILAFFLYMLMLGGLGSLQFFLFGIVLAGLISLVFRGLPGAQYPGFSKFFIALILIINLMVLAAPVLISDWVFKGKSDITTSPYEIVKSEKLALPNPKIESDTNSLHEKQKSEKMESSEQWKLREYKEKVYIDLLKSAVKSQDYVKYDEFMRAMRELREMGSDNKIPIPLIIDALKKTYENANKYEGEYKDIAIEAINFFARIKAKEACELLYQVQSKGGYLFEYTKKAAKEICGY